MVDGIPGRHRELGRPVIGPVGGAAGSGTAYGNVTTPRQKNGGVRCPGSHIRKNSGSCLLKHCPGKFSNKQFLQTFYVRYTSR